MTQTTIPPSESEHQALEAAIAAGLASGRSPRKAEAILAEAKARLQKEMDSA